MSGTYSNLLYHVVFSTKERLPLMSMEWREELYRYMGGIARHEKGVLLEIGGTSDHVHIIIKLKTDHELSKMIMHIKGGSSKWLNEKFQNKKKFGWQDGYGAFTVSESLMPSLCKYIQGQTEHHHKKTFQEEFVEFLKLNRIDYDERYLWD